MGKGGISKETHLSQTEYVLSKVEVATLRQKDSVPNVFSQYCVSNNLKNTAEKPWSNQFSSGIFSKPIEDRMYDIEIGFGPVAGLSQM